VPSIFALVPAIRLLDLPKAVSYGETQAVAHLVNACSVAGLVGLITLPWAFMLSLGRRAPTHAALLVLLFVGLCGEAACVAAGLTGRLGGQSGGVPF
jgi:hypothetical protein